MRKHRVEAPDIEEGAARSSEPVAAVGEPERVLALQRSAGNRAVGELLRTRSTGRSLQRFLTLDGTKLDPANDRDEITAIALDLEQMSAALALAFRNAAASPDADGDVNDWVTARLEAEGVPDRDGESAESGSAEAAGSGSATEEESESSSESGDDAAADQAAQPGPSWWSQSPLGTTAQVLRAITQAPNHGIVEIISMLENDPNRKRDVELAKRYLSKRAEALVIVNHFGHDATVAAVSAKFPGIRKDQVASHLKATIENPATIHQRNMEWCGPNTFLMVIARNDPIGYARYVTGLYRRGKGKLGTGLKVTPAKKFRRKGGAQGGLADADWVALGSLRSSTNASLDATSMPFGSGTLQHDVVGWFEKYGVPKNQIAQEGGITAKTNPSSLRDANARLNAGWNVILWVHKKTLTGATAPGNLATILQGIPAFEITKTHWVVMDGPFVHDAAQGRWSCPVNTWGGKGANTVWVSDQNVSSSVFGFVAVDMQAQIRKPSRPGAGQ